MSIALRSGCLRLGGLVIVTAALLPSQVLKLTEPQEIEVGRRAAAEVEFEQPLFQDPKATAYLQKIGLRLARESERPGLRFSFKILESDDINGYSLPGGFIYVTRGLVERVRDETELAAALAHEIGHIAARQHAGKIRRSQLASLGVSFLGPAVGGGLRATAALRGARSGSRGLFMRFTREDEREADRIGAKILYDSGYDPEGLLRLFKRLAALQEDDPALLQRYFRSHAKLEDRIDSLTDLLATFPASSSGYRSSDEFPRIQQHIAAVKPKGALTSSDAASAVIEAGEDAADSQQAKDREVAALFAPVFYQGLGDEPRYDYITNFDFDGDWRGDNNWANAANKEYPLKAWVYYSVRETRTHYFIHYAVFHPRDYKGGSRTGKLFSKVIRTATKPAASVDPTGRASEAVLAHENDLEGCLVVVAKHGDGPQHGKVVFVQTLAHNNFLKYVPENEPREGFDTVALQGRRVKLFIEPKGHGIEAYRPDTYPTKLRMLVYIFTGQAQTPKDNPSQPAGYDLAPIATTLWAEAQRGITPAYAEVEDFGIVLLDMADGDREQESVWKVGRIGSAFRGNVGGANLARPPWGWFDAKDKSQPLGQWFFDPARVVRRDYGLDPSFPVAYLRPWPPQDPQDASLE
jgi:Zn-dependent protease with chaperone function